jgi:folate-binding protein YgfZ
MAGDFRVEDFTDESVMLSVQGARAAQTVGSVFNTIGADLRRDGVSEVEGVTVMRATHTGEDGFDLVADSARAAELRRALLDAGATPVDEATFEILRIEAGIARFGRDMDETNVIPETNLDDAVSYTKGCYVGQEIIVRIKHRGHPAKKFVGLRAYRPLERGAIVTSAAVSPKAGNIGLGYVRYESIEPGTEVIVDNEIKATVTELPFIRGSWYG